jgi:hypothetical protein
MPQSIALARRTFRYVASYAAIALVERQWLTASDDGVVPDDGLSCRTGLTLNRPDRDVVPGSVGLPAGHVNLDPTSGLVCLIRTCALKPVTGVSARPALGFGR